MSEYLLLILKNIIYKKKIVISHLLLLLPHVAYYCLFHKPQRDSLNSIQTYRKGNSIVFFCVK